MEISFHSHLYSNTVIATNFCTRHDSCAVVACAKICCDLMTDNGITARRSFHRIWIAGKKSLVKRAPGESIMNWFTTTKQGTTQPYSLCMGHTVPVAGITDVDLATHLRQDVFVYLYHNHCDVICSMIPVIWCLIPPASMERINYARVCS